MLPIRAMLVGGATGAGRFTRTINIANSVNLVNGRTLSNNIGYLGDRPATIIFNIPLGILLQRGFSFGNWPEFEHVITLNIDGSIQGAEGIGGVSTFQGFPGSAGGDAVTCTLAATINIAASAQIKGGSGGGGGGGGSARMAGPPGEEELQEIYGGAGGDGWPFNTAAFDNGGSGGVDPATAGSPGAAGSASTGGTYPWTNYAGGAGGAAGYAVRHNGHVVTINNLGGTIVGTNA